MTVKDIVKCCYDKIVIYTNIDDDFLEFEDLYVGKKDGIPKDLLSSEVRCFGAKRKGIIEISIRKDDEMNAYEYKGFRIEPFGSSGEGFTVFFEGDEKFFRTVERAKMFIDELTASE